DRRRCAGDDPGDLRHGRRPGGVPGLAVPTRASPGPPADHRRNGPVHGPRPRPRWRGARMTPRYAVTAMAESSAAEAAGKKPGAARRGPDEVRRLLLDAARSLFAAKGYAGASTRDIALTAG